MKKHSKKKFNLKKAISLLMIISGLVLLLTKPASARECHTVYGGGEVCESGELSIDKKVYNPEEGEYWDNIDSEDYTFAPDEEVKFSLKVKNISDVRVDNVRINDDFDRLDDYMIYVSSDKGDYRAEVTDYKVKFAFGGLNPDEEVTVYFISKVKAADLIPVGTTCLTNAAHAYSHEDSISDSDYASFCIATDSGKIITGSTPDTGINLSVVFGLEALFFLSLGIFALNKANKMSK